MKMQDFHEFCDDMALFERNCAQQPLHDRGLPDAVAGFKNENGSSQNRPAF